MLSMTLCMKQCFLMWDFPLWHHVEANTCSKAERCGAAIGMSSGHIRVLGQISPPLLVWLPADPVGGSRR